MLNLMELGKLCCYAVPRGRNVNYDEKQLTGGKKVSAVPSICIGFVNKCPTVIL